MQGRVGGLKGAWFFSMLWHLTSAGAHGSHHLPLHPRNASVMEAPGLLTWNAYSTLLFPLILIWEVFSGAPSQTGLHGHRVDTHFISSTQMMYAGQLRISLHDSDEDHE